MLSRHRSLTALATTAMVPREGELGAGPGFSRTASAHAVRV